MIYDRADDCLQSIYAYDNATDPIVCIYTA